MSAKMRTPSLIVIFIVSLIFQAGARAQQRTWNVTSPNGKLSAIIAQEKLGEPFPSQNNLYYRIELNGKEILPLAPLGVTMAQAEYDFVSDLAFVSEESKSIDETYPMLTGKKSVHRNHANEKTLVFRNSAGNIVHIVFRAYDDGIAFRYHFPGRGDREIVSEASAFRLPSGSVGWLLQYKPQYEGNYLKTDALAPKRLYCFPALFRTSGGAWVLATEAAVYGDYAGSALLGSLSEPGIFAVRRPHKVSGKLPWTTPWRVAVIGDNLGAIVESVIVDNLNPPCEVQDTSWIKPGRSTFPWWSDHQVSSNFERLKKFVDMAGEMGWEWIEFDTALAYPGGEFDASRDWLAASPWIPEFVKYAADKKLCVYGWDHWRNLDTPDKRAKMFELFNKLGLKGIKIDFMDSDSQETFKWYDDTIRDCAKYKLMVSFHGATIPRGQRRLWPHIMTWEAVLGAEYYTFGNHPPTPAHNCTLPYTRNVVGPMDYTGVTFTAPGKKTTNAHELALAVIFESGWQNISDKPEAYAASPGKPFLKEVPATWDDIHFIDGYPGEFVCLARRKGNDWFLAAINAEKPQDITIPLDFLKKGTYSVKPYCDDDSAKDITVKDVTLDTSKPFVISLPPNGGFCTKVSGCAK
jgi:alpha-glucosidase